MLSSDASRVLLNMSATVSESSLNFAFIFRRSSASVPETLFASLTRLWS